MTLSIPSSLWGAERGHKSVVRKWGASIIHEIDVHLFMLTGSGLRNFPF